VGTGNIFKETTDLLDNNRTLINAMTRKWLDGLKVAEIRASNDGKLFHEPTQLRVYLSLTGIKEPSPIFSLRHCGQEVGTIKIVKGIPVLRLTKAHKAKNDKYFGCLDLDAGQYGWNSPEARKFRRHFAKKPVGKTGVPEHRIESALIKEMESGSRNKLSGKCGLIQPVKLAGCPLQIPLPISASSGKPVFKTRGAGHVDILARRKSGPRSWLSICELKAPGKVADAVAQAYIYTLTVRDLLRSAGGNEWYELFKFTTPVPDALELEAVVAVTEDVASRIAEQYQDLKAHNPLQIGNDRITFWIATYKDTPKFQFVDFRQL